MVTSVLSVLKSEQQIFLHVLLKIKNMKLQNLVSNKTKSCNACKKQKKKNKKKQRLGNQQNKPNKVKKKKTPLGF